MDDYLFDGKYILLGEDGENVLSRNLPLAFIVAGQFWVNNHAHIFQPINGVDINYLCDYLESLDYKNIASGSAQPKITKDSLKKIRILLPQSQEQKKIASILTSVDDVIEKTDAQISKLQDLKKGMMTELLTKGIGHTEFKDSPVGRIPVSWEVQQCVSICTKITDGEHLSPKYVENGYPIVSAKDIREYGIDDSGAKFVSRSDFAKMLKRCNAEYGDVLIVSRGATIGKTTLNYSHKSYALMGSVILLKPNEKWCVGEFLSLFIAMPNIQKEMLQLSGSSAQQAIYLKDIKNMYVPVPTIDEQEKIANAIKSIDQNIIAKQKQLSQTKSLKKALMSDLLTGKKRVNVN